MTPKTLDQMAGDITSWHECVSADCSHETYRDCFDAVAIEGARALAKHPSLLAMRGALLNVQAALASGYSPHQDAGQQIYSFARSLSISAVAQFDKLIGEVGE